MKSIKEVLQSDKGLLELAGTSIDLDKLKLDQLINDHLTKDLPNISWNHAKILAVNGKTMMTGGGNYWREYLGGEHNIIDHQVKVHGDAAISAHKYCDYFWRQVISRTDHTHTDGRCCRYLNKSHEFDKISFRRSIPLNATSFSQWSSTNPVPEHNPFTMSLTKPKIPVLTVGRLGDWHGTMSALPYPVQIIDAARDIIFCALWHTTSTLQQAAQGQAMFQASYALQDDMSTEFLFRRYQKLQLNPVAWASRIARYVAISNSSTSVHVSQQMLVGTLQAGDKAFQEVTNGVNSYIEKSMGRGHEKWDGWIWPFGRFLEFLCFAGDPFQRVYLLPNHETNIS